MPSPNPSEPTLTRDSEKGGEAIQPKTEPSKKNLKFWLIFLTMCLCLFLSALELFAISTALLAIVDALDATHFAWIASAYALSSTAFLPLSGCLAQMFGRRSVILVSIGFFALGSGICGAATSMNMLIAGRTIQGLGGGGIHSLTGIVLADLVTLRERGVYAGLYGLTWCFAASVGPIIGGSLAAQGRWRWLFYLNLPLSFVACLSVIFLLDLPAPESSFREKVKRMDWIGNFLVISSTVAYTMGLTWGGMTAPWSSVMVLVPLVLGLVGLIVFIAYEATWATHPLVPFSLMTNLTSLSGYIQTFCTTVVTFATVYFFPIYFQACKDASPVKSGVYQLAFASLAPAAIVAGLSVKATERYRPQMWLAWTLVIVALGLMSTLLATDSLGKSTGCLVLLGLGIGILQTTTMYPIQSPLPVTQNATALSFMWFLRLFATVWGVTIGNTALQNELAKRLPASLSQSGENMIMFALIPELPMLSPELRFEVQAAFASSLAVLWQVLIGISGAGLLASLFMKGLPLHNTLDEDWAIVAKE